MAQGEARVRREDEQGDRPWVGAGGCLVLVPGVPNRVVRTTGGYSLDRRSLAIASIDSHYLVRELVRRTRYE